MRICVMANARAVHTQRWAQAYAERGHEVCVLSIRRAEIPGVDVRTCHVGPVNSASWLWTLLSYGRLLLAGRRLLRRAAPDVLHAHFTITHGVIAALSGFRPRLLTAWGSDVIWGGQGNAPWWFRMLNRIALRGVDGITSASRFMLDRIGDLTPNGAHLHMVPFGVDPARFRPGEKSAHREVFRIGFVKTLHPKYGPEYLLRAMPAVLRAVPQARLVLAGRGPMTEDIRALIAELKLEERVELVGFVPNDEVPKLLRSFDVFVNSSVVPESFGVAVLEASACGLPVVATRVGGVPEVCWDGETGLLVEPGDSRALAQAIIRLAGDESLRARLGDAGRRFVCETYVWCDNVDAMLAHLRALVDELRRAEPVPLPPVACER